MILQYEKLNKLSHSSQKIIELFLDAKKNGGVQYIFALVRAEGWTSYKTDPIKSFAKKIKKYKNKLLENLLINEMNFKKIDMSFLI